MDDLCKAFMFAWKNTKKYYHISWKPSQKHLHCESLGNISVDFLPRFLIIKKCTCNCTCRTDKYRHAYSTRYTIKNLGADTIVNESKMIVRGISETSSAFRRKVNTSLSVELISQACQLKSVNCEALSCNSYFFRISLIFRIVWGSTKY